MQNFPRTASGRPLSHVCKDLKNIDVYTPKTNEINITHRKANYIRSLNLLDESNRYNERLMSTQVYEVIKQSTTLGLVLPYSAIIWSLPPTNVKWLSTNFKTLIPSLTFTEIWVVSMDHLQRQWYAIRERLPFRMPGSVPHFGTCLCSNCWDQIPRTSHIFTRLFTSNTPWYFLDFA